MAVQAKRSRRRPWERWEVFMACLTALLAVGLITGRILSALHII